MHRHFRFVGLLVFVASTTLIVGSPSVFAQVNGKTQRATKDSNAVPSNYRQLVARSMASRSREIRILSAQISRPGVWVGPFGLGTPTPIVCAKMNFQGTYIQQDATFGFTFKNGQIAEVFNPHASNPAAGGAFAAAMKNSYTCGKLSYGAFPELLTATRGKR